MNTKWTAALVLVLTLILGIVLGALGGRVYMQSRFPRGRPPMRQVDRDLFVTRMVQMLDVKPDQEDTVRAILAAHSARFLALHERQTEETARLLDTLRANLEPVLTPEQRARFEEHSARIRFRGGPHAPRPPHGP